MPNSTDSLIIKEAMIINHKQASVKTASNDVVEYVNEVKSSEETKFSDTQHQPDLDDQSSGNINDSNVLNLEFNRANIEALGNHIHLVDTDEEHKLDMFCYVKCSESDNNLLKQCRGVVFNGDKLVMKSFPYTTEYNHSEVNEINSALGKFEDWTFYESYEGALLRMFNFNGKWFITTHRKLNAFRSKWASRESFGTSFKTALSVEENINPVFNGFLPDGDNILERFESVLDVKKQYMFLISNTKDNRIVCNAPERPTVYHVGTFVDGVLDINDNNINLPSPKKLNISNIEELTTFVSCMSYKHYQGVIGFNKDNKQIKIFNKDYQDLFRVRGNEPSIKFRYLQVRMNRKLVKMLYHLYPELVETFDEYENTLYDIARSIYRSYVHRFIKKQYVTVPREEYAIIRECHEWHLSNRTDNRISIDHMVRIMNKQSPTHLNHMIRRFKLEQFCQKGQQHNDRNRSDSVTSTKSFEKTNISYIEPPLPPLLNL